MDTYWNVGMTLYRADDSPRTWIKITTYENGGPTKDIVDHHLTGPVDEDEAQRLIWILNTAILSRLNVQLGLELGLIS